MPSLYRQILCLILALVGPALTAPAVIAADPVKLPFRIELEETIGPSKLPGLHSFAMAVAGRRCLLLGGRQVGMHGFGDRNNFPRQSANTYAFVVDLVSRQVLGKLDLTILGPELAGPLTSTNAQFVQRGSDLYVVGGYGLDLSKANPDALVTFDTVIRIRAEELMRAIESREQNPANLQQFFAVAHDARLKVTGGELRWLNDRFVLVFGHRFDGLYSINLRDYNRLGGMEQKYTQKVRVFTLDDQLKIGSYKEIDGGYDESQPYNRRDLNVAELILPDDKTESLVALGGVFKAGQVAGHLNPIEIVPRNDADVPIGVNWVKSFQQGLNHYDCARVSLFDARTHTAFVALFGGISQFWFDKVQNRLVHDKVDLDRGIDGLPFIDSITVVTRDAKGGYRQDILPWRLPGLTGTEARFVVAPSVPAHANGVLKLEALKCRTLVGHIYGGIEAQEPYSVLPGGQSRASDRVFKVWLSPDTQETIPLPAIPEEPDNGIRAANAQFSAAVAKGDAAAVASVYSDDAQVFPPGSGVIKGQDAIKAFWQKVLDGGVKGVKLRTAQVESSGVLAVETGQYQLLNAQGTNADAGNYSVVWKLQDGRWKLYRDIWNSNATK